MLLVDAEAVDRLAGLEKLLNLLLSVRLLEQFVMENEIAWEIGRRPSGSQCFSLDV